MSDHGFQVAVYNRTVEKVDHFLANEAKGASVIGAHSIAGLVSLLKPPKRVMLMVKAGEPVDEFISLLVPHLSAGDIIIDGGNSLYTDTKRRCETLEAKGLLYVGCGVSGGEEGARCGPSIMPGGSPQAWPHIKDIFQSIAAKSDGRPCCDWVGSSGSGHFVKMVHNGIEYGDMQLIAETYHIARSGLGLRPAELAALFHGWRQKGSALESFLIDITAEILAIMDKEGRPLIDSIRDAAGQKGTGKWTVIAALEYGIPGTLFAEAVFARSLSSLKQERLEISKHLQGPPDASAAWTGDKKEWLAALHEALLASKIISYAQGFRLMQAASTEHQWDLNYAGIAQMWQGGCIIRRYPSPEMHHDASHLAALPLRSGLLNHIRDAYLSSESRHLLLHAYFQEALSRAQSGWRRIVAAACLSGMPAPALSSALAYYDGLRCPVLPANLIQAQRDYFGAHTYELDANPGVFIHTNWTGKGGSVSSSAYRA